MSTLPITSLPYAKPSVSFQPVDPATAARWLNHNTRNRKLFPQIVNKYARDMLAGNWHLAGDPIRFSHDGTLLDGQHRLAAVVKSRMTIVFCVQRGIDSAAQAVMDTGKARTAADAITIAGGKYASLRAAVAKIAILVDRDQINQAQSGGNVTHKEILDWIASNPDELPAAEFAIAHARQTDCPIAVVAYTYLMLSRIDPGDAASFWIDASTKVGLADGDPVIALTNRFAEARRSREHVTREMHLSAIYRAWNARRSGKTLRRIVLSGRSGVVPIPMPK